MREELAARMSPRSAALARSTVATLSTSLVVCLAALFSGVPAVTTAAAVGGALTLAAVASGSRVLGSAATAMLTVAVILWLLLTPEQPALVPVIGVALLMSASAGLDALELRLRRQLYDVIRLPTRWQRLAAPAIALSAAGVVLLVAAQPVGGSEELVVLGLLASVAALVIALRRL